MKIKIINSIQNQLFELTNRNFSKKYIEIYILPIINYIICSKNNKFIISGSQGIGKSTLLKIIEKNLKLFFKKNVLALSLDDYYLSKLQRVKLSKKFHKLFITRGVPGTHDIKQLKRNIKSFNKSKYPIILPIFNKIDDDVSNKIKKIKEKSDILILEGWCCGCPPLKKHYLFKDINNLEKEKDKTKIWRRKYNQILKDEYSSVFKLFDEIIYLKAPSFKFVFNWRMKQENMLRSKNKKKMRKTEIKEFISHYEKITKWMMKVLPEKANMIIYANEKQKIKKLIIKK